MARAIPFVRTVMPWFAGRSGMGWGRFLFFDVVGTRVVNGASEVLGEIFGDRGKHARSAVGVVSLPLNAPVEVELVVAVS